MSRVIKFRAWDNINKRMMYFKDGFGWHDEYDLWYLQYDETKHLYGKGVSDVSCEENINLMQFTGLKDKNGNEIYEGDIVHTWAFGEGEVFYWTEMMAFAFKDEKEPDNKMKWTLLRKPLEHYDIKIIGNIYQHPELITAKTLTP